MRRQAGFFDVDDRLKRLSDLGDQLEAFEAAVEFEAFRPELNAALTYSGTQGGRPPFDPVMMFKILVIQTTNNLSDERAEFLINDRLSFMRFLGFGLSDRVPDARTIWLFREKLNRAKRPRRSSSLIGGSPLFQRPDFRTSTVADSAPMPCARRAQCGHLRRVGSEEVQEQQAKAEHESEDDADRHIALVQVFAHPAATVARIMPQSGVVPISTAAVAPVNPTWRGRGRQRLGRGAPGSSRPAPRRSRRRWRPRRRSA
jgi:hypothetical protein